MTASDHLKQRLATGSLVGDQDEKELVAAYEHWSDPMTDVNCDNLTVASYIEEIISLRAALAQKTRECDALDEIHRGHVEGTLCEQIEAERDALKSQVEQLQRQVAAEKEKHEYFISLYEPQHRQALEERDEARRQVAELSKPVTASRTPNPYYLQAIHKFARQKSKQGFPIDKTDEWDNR